MKQGVILVVITMIFCFTIDSYSQAVQYFGDVKVKAQIAYDPGIQATNLTVTGVKKPLKWIMFNVDYKSASKSDRRSKSIIWLDDVIMKYDVLLPKVSSKPRVVLSGQIEYWALPLDGEVHHAQAFIHPAILKRYVPSLKLSKSKLKELKLKITFIYNESPVGVGVLKRKSSTKSIEISNAIRKALLAPSTKKVKDSIYNRNETPWGVLNLTYYELIKRAK